MIYIVQIDPDGPVKIGYSSWAYRRINSIQIAIPFPLKVLAINKKGTEEDEARLLYRFRHSCIRGEWFHPTPELLALAQPNAHEDYIANTSRVNKTVARNRRIAECVKNGESVLSVMNRYDIGRCTVVNACRAFGVNAGKRVAAAAEPQSS